MPVRGTVGSIHYTKFPDGTMVVWGQATITNFTTSYVDVTLPVSFTDRTKMQIDANANTQLSGSAGYSYLVEPSVQTESVVRIKAMAIGPSGVNNVGSNTSVRFKVIGFWK